MEELSIEEKARRYDEAIEIAKDCQYDGLALSQPVKDVIEHIFPELKEDERIKNCIKKCLSNAGEHVFDNYHIRLGDCLAWIEKQDNQEKQSKKSQESTSEECKFKVGDWVVRKDGKNFGTGSKFAQITNIDKEKCWFNSGTWTTDKCLRLWTIQDAKNGDALASNYSVFVFRKLDIEGKPTAYCGIVEGVFHEANGGCWTEGQCYPATKEQCKLLFQKMKEAGYYWDFENKKLNPLIVKEKEQLKFDTPDNKISDCTSIKSRLSNIPEDLKPAVDFIMRFAHWNLNKDEVSSPLAEIPLYIVLDALSRREEK